MSSSERLPELSAAPEVAGGPRTGAERRAFLRVLGAAAGLFFAISLTYLIPPLHPLRPWVKGGDYVPFWNLVGREFLGQGEALERDARALSALGARSATPSSAPARRPAPAPRTSVFPAYEPELARPEHRVEPPEALASFFKQLTLVDLGVPGAIARAGHWGDSIIGMDGIPSGIRRRLQARFGDAGHGFHLIDRYNPSYRQQGIEFEPQGGWFRCLVVQECSKKDRRYGYGGLIVTSSGGGQSLWKTTASGFGSQVSRFELWYSTQPEGGNLEITVDGDKRTTVSTRGEVGDGWHAVKVPAGPHRFLLRATGGGPVRAYGVVLENDGPGVVWDGMALIGGSSRGLRTQEPAHIAAQIARRELDLIVFQFGGNDLERNYVDLKESMQPYYDEYGEVIRNFRAERPEASCLIIGVGDHGKKLPSGEIVSRSFVPVLSNAQREVAHKNGCAFFDLDEAVGGDGAVARWWRARPRLISPDLGHPNPFGHEVIAQAIAGALLFGYEEYRTRMAGKPLPELDPKSGEEPPRRAPQRAGEPGDAGASAVKEPPGD